MKIHHSHIHPIGIQNKKSPMGNQAVSDKKVNNSFANHLQQALHQEKGLTLSKHAQTRLEQRNISISEEHWEKINSRVNEARQMGVNQSLVLLDHAALIVSAKNNTVITALNREEATNQVFTNINGTIIIDN